jgi:hypothetical protein
MSIRGSLIFLSFFCLSSLNLLDSSISEQKHFVISQSSFSSKALYNSRNSKIFGKQGSPIIAEIYTELLNPDIGQMQISADLTSAILFNDIKYKWILPESLSLSSGEIEGSIVNLSKENPANLVITVSNLDVNINQNIILLVERNDGVYNLASSFVVASRKDLTDEYKVDEYKKVLNNRGEKKQLKTISFDDNKTANIKLVY